MKTTTTTTTEGPAATTEAAPAGFEDLATEAASLEGGPPIPGTPEAAASEADALKATAAELLQALVMARMLCGPMFAWWPDFGRVWSEQTLQGIANGGAAVMLRHGWTMGEFFEKWGPYIALAMATAPPCAVTYQAIKAHRHQLQQQQQHGQAPRTTSSEGANHASDGKAPD